MAHVVTERCINCRYTECAEVCPVQCFWEIADPAMLVIDPGTCIDCGLCVSQCPVHAIYPDLDLPDPFRPWLEKNRELFPKGTNISASKEPLPTAVTLQEILERERRQGWTVEEPGGAAA